MQLTPRYTSEQLSEAVASSSNIRQVCLQLGLRGRGGNYETIRRHIKQLRIDTTHFHHQPARTFAVQGRLFDECPRVGRSNLPATVEELELAVARSRSIAEVARRLGLKVGTQSYRVLHQLMKRYQLDTSHFKGQGWSKGESVQIRAPRPLAEILVQGDRPYQSSRLKERLIQEGLKPPCCESCGAEEWQGHLIPLELDHMNGDRRDNRLENLRLLCPNCHALTDNYRGRNIGRICP